MAMTCFIENIENIEDCNFPIIHYALKSASGRKQVKASFSGKVHSRIYSFVSLASIKVRSRMTHCSTSLWLDLWNTFGLKSNSIKQNEIFNFSIEASFELLMYQKTLFVIFWHQGHSRITTTFKFPSSCVDCFPAKIRHSSTLY